jgi:hypothetical protein
VTRLLKLIRALDPRALERSASRADTLSASVKALRQDVRSLHEAVTDLARQLVAMQAQAEQLAVLHEEDRHAGARMDALERVLDVKRVSEHCLGAIRDAAIAEAPVSYTVVPDVLPSDIYTALVDAIPPDVFFDLRGPHWRELPIPPRLAPTHVVVAWTFLADVVKRVFGPALVERFRPLLEKEVRALCPGFSEDIGFAVSRGRLVLRQPGFSQSGRRGRSFDLLTAVLWLARAEDGPGYGFRVDGKEIPFQANTLGIVFDSTGRHEYVPVPGTAAADLRRYSYEFRVGADAASRRRLLLAMDEPTRRAWEAADAQP